MKSLIQNKPEIELVCLDDKDKYINQRDKPKNKNENKSIIKAKDPTIFDNVDDDYDDEWYNKELLKYYGYSYY